MSVGRGRHAAARGSHGTAPGSGTEAEGGDRGDLREAFRYSLMVFLGLRIGLSILAVLAIGLMPHDLKPTDVPGWAAPPFTTGPHLFVTVWERSDGLWFLRIADGGYGATDHSAVFFPLYPMLVRGVSWALGGHPLPASLLVSNLSFLGALVVLYRLTAREWGRRVARNSVLLMALFPTSFFYLAPYSESTFLLCAVGAFAAARSRRWPLAGALGALAALTRNVGVVLAPALAVEAIHQHIESRRRSRVAAPADGPGPTAVGPGADRTVTGGAEAGTDVRGANRRLAVALWSSALPVAGLVSYLVFWGVRYGRWLEPLTDQSAWQRKFQFPWMTIVHATQQALSDLGSYPNGGYHLLDWLVMVPALVVAVYGLFRLRPGYSVFTWGCLTAALAFPWAPRAFMSDYRFVLPLFPIVWMVALLIERGRLPRTAVIGVFAAGLGLLTALWVNSYYIF